MAEARNAMSVNREPGFHAKHDASDLGEGWKHYYISWLRELRRHYYRTRNLIRNGLWPASLWNLGVVMLLLTSVQVFNIPLTAWLAAKLLLVANNLPLPEVIPYLLRDVLASIICAFMFFIALLYLRRFALRALLAYRGWMYEPPRKQSFITLLWGIVVRIISGSHPTLYSYQRSLPRLSVPPLQKTIDRLLTSLKPLYADRPEEFSELKREALEFERTLGPKLQRVLVAKSWWSPNYVSDWWEKYVYLMGRSPLPVNSNYYIMDQSNWSPTTSQSSRAATVTYNILLAKQMFERQTWEPLVVRGTIPMCMAQYERVFSTTRIPGEELDTVVHYDPMDSRHIVVHRKGVLYKMYVYDSHKRILAPQTLEKQFQWILQDAERFQEEYADCQKSIPALTSLDRVSWWRIRNEHFKSGVNKESLHFVESALVFMNLDIHSYPFKAYSERAASLLHGDGRGIWFDKSFTVIIFEDGKMGLNCEHSYADAPVVGHSLEYNMVQE